MWVDDLPSVLKKQVESLISDFPKSEPVLSQLVSHYTSIGQDKRRKTNVSKISQVSKIKSEALESGPLSVLENHDGLMKVERLSEHILDITSPLKGSEVIFELPGLSFVSPNRRKLNLVFHLYFASPETPSPVLSVVNPTTLIPEISVTNLQSAIELCVVLPILGNSTVSTKRDTVMMALWLHKSAVVAEGKHDPIICTFNLDVVKKHLVEAGKIPAHAEAQISQVEADSQSIKPMNELIIDFLQRQFSLCGMKLINFLPSTNPGRNSLNMNDDNVICISQASTINNDLVIAAAYKGSKEGAILLVTTSPDTAFLIFGFKKPIVLMHFTSIKAISYSNITRFTFSILITRVNEEGKEESYEFGMIDQKAFQSIDDFVKRMNIEDNSFDEKHREKRVDVKEDPVIPVSGNGSTLAQVNAALSDDEEEDGTYTGAVEEDESGCDIDEDFDSEADSGSGSGSEEDDEEENEADGKEEQEDESE